MGKRYQQLCIEERCEISRLHSSGASIRQIASAPDRQPSIIARELRGNRGRQVGYRPSYADQQARARRWTGSKLERNDSLREAVLGVGVWMPSVVIGVVALLMIAVGMIFGSKLGLLFGRRVGLIGGLILIGIGIKILVEHTM